MAKITFSSKAAYSLLVLALIIGIGIGAYAQGTAKVSHKITEIEGLEAKIQELVGKAKPSENLVEGKYVSIKTQEKWKITLPNPPSYFTGGEASLAQFTNVHGRGKIERAGCHSAMTYYCLNHGYEAAVVISDNGGWKVANAAACPDVDFEVQFYCIRT